MKENEGLYRFLRFVRQLVVGTVVLVVAVVAFGYFFFVRQVDTPDAWRDATRELRSSVLRYGEVPRRQAHVYQRRTTNYYRAANGVLAATPDRLLYVGLEPKDKLESEDAPAAILTNEFPNDTLLYLEPARLYALTAHGVIIRRQGRREIYAAARGYEAELDSLVAYVNREHRAQRAAAAAERELRAAVAAMLRRPLKYEVKRGDALSTIAARFGVTLDQIREWNHMTGDKVRIRDTLLVKPEGSPVPSPSAAPKAPAKVAAERQQH
jgi:hypothetical protein